MREFLLVLMVPLLAGCFATDAPAEPEPEPVVTPATFDGRVVMDVPIDVVMIGYDEGVAEAVAGGLNDLRVNQQVYNNARFLNPMGGLTSPVRDTPMDLTATYNVRAAPAAVLDQIVAGTQVADGMLLANSVDDAINAALMEHGLGFDINRPGLVLMNFPADLTDASRHSYRLEYVTGYIEGVRVFGERNGYLVVDTAAEPDSYAGSGLSYQVPLAASGQETVDALVQLTHQATWFRLLQGPLYPQSTQACHAVTLVLAVRGTAVSQVLPGYSSAEDLLDVDGLTTAWESMLGTGRVFVDAKTLLLPADDPVLEAALRDQSNEALRTWADQTWSDYWVAHDGCEAYISVFLFGDASDRGISGIAMYDLNDDRRISMSSMNDMNLMQEQDGTLGPVLYVEDASRNETDWVDFLFSHETGHLFGQRHPHDLSGPEAPSGERTFSSVWSAMSYQQDGKIPLFGSVDTANHWRNRAGFIMQEAAANSLETTPEFEQALMLLGEYRWQEAGDVVQPLLP